MDTSEYLKCRWRTLSSKTWSRLPYTYYENNSTHYTKESIEIFAESVFRDTARELCVSFDEIKDFLEEQNQPFYRELDRIFKDKGSVNESYIRDLKKYLVIPDTDTIVRARRLNERGQNSLMAISWWKNLVEKAERIFNPNKNQGLLPAPSHVTISQQIIEHFKKLNHDEQVEVLKELHGIVKDSQVSSED